MSINDLTDLITQYISIGFSMSVILSFVAWSIMKVWRIFTDIAK
jgi:hypothetical protein